MSKNIVPLIFVNNMENHEYYAKGTLIEHMKNIYIKNKKTGKYDKIKVHSYDSEVPYGYMGRPCIAFSKHYFIQTSVFGVVMDVPVANLIHEKPKSFYVDAKKTSFYK